MAWLGWGRERNDGGLPPVEEMAWTLRQSDHKVLVDPYSLAEVGVVHEAEPLLDRATWIGNFESVRDLLEAKIIFEWR
jgi:hypothetical protein